jgi:hypothetical protein
MVLRQVGDLINISTAEHPGWITVASGEWMEKSGENVVVVLMFDVGDLEVKLRFVVGG